jgi:hypothetical protein
MNFCSVEQQIKHINYFNNNMKKAHEIKYGPDNEELNYKPLTAKEYLKRKVWMHRYLGHLYHGVRVEVGEDDDDFAKQFQIQI